jgi:hypothetical protein
MQRYKFMFSKDHPWYGGTIHSNMDGSGHEYMKPTPDGSYVDYTAAEAEIKKATQEGYEQASKDLASTNQVDTNHSRSEGTNPEKQSKRAAAIDEYLNPPHPKFPKGTRVNHKFHKVPGTVLGEVRKRGRGYADDVEVRFDDGYQDYCHLEYMTPITPAYVPPTDGEIFWSDFNKAGMSAPVPLTETQQYQAGVRFMEDKLRVEQATGKKLLNELYHDRARLERVVKEACATMQLIRNGLNLEADGIEEITREDKANWLGAVAQFVDLHANE